MSSPATRADDAVRAVTVVVRSMDRACLARALQSLAAQTLPPAEVVVVNALGAAHRPLAGVPPGLPLRLVGAPDGAPLPRPAAANLGLREAHGGALLFLDDDDLLLPDHLARLADALQRHPRAWGAFADVEHGRFDDAGRWVAQHRFAAPFDALRLRFENYLPIHAVLLRRSGAVAALRFDESLPVFEDWDFWLQCSELGEPVRVEGVSARYLADSGGGSQVFEDTETSRQARAALWRKWHARLDAAQYAALMTRLQQVFRDGRHAAERARALDDEVASLQALCAARDAEIAALHDERERSAQAREVERAAALEHAAGLQALVAARDAELATLHDEHARVTRARADEQAAALEHAAGLQALVAARAAEQAAALEHAASLQAVVAAREAELAALHDEHARVAAAREAERAAALEHAAGLGAVIAAREAEIAALQSALHSTRELLQQAQAEVLRLQTEPPMRALARALRHRFHGS